MEWGDRSGREYTPEGEWSRGVVTAEFGVRAILFSPDVCSAKAVIESGYDLRARLLVPDPTLSAGRRPESVSIEWEMYFTGVQFRAELHLKVPKRRKEEVISLLTGDPPGQPRRSGVFPGGPCANYYQMRKEVTILAAKTKDCRDAMAEALHRYGRLRRWAATDNLTPFANNLGVLAKPAWLTAQESGSRKAAAFGRYLWDAAPGPWAALAAKYPVLCNGLRTGVFYKKGTTDLDVPALLGVSASDPAGPETD